MSSVPSWYLAVAAFVAGSGFGSFATVAIHRIPLGRSVVRPRSACPQCGTPIAAFDNVPLISYLLLRGRCRHCRAPIPLRYPAVELATGAVWVLVLRRIGLAADLPAFLAFGTALVILSAIDLEHRRLPNRVLGPAALLAVLVLSAAAALTRDWRPLLGAAAGALAYGLPILAIGLAVPSGMGGGDVKLAGYLGLHLGWLGLGHVLVGALSGFLLGGVAGVVLLATGRKGRKDPIPFGPFMAAGALAAVAAGPQVLALWLA